MDKFKSLPVAKAELMMLVPHHHIPEMHDVGKKSCIFQFIETDDLLRIYSKVDR